MIIKRKQYFKFVILKYKCNNKKYKSTRGEMDITTVFGTVIGGSNPSECTQEKVNYLIKY